MALCVRKEDYEKFVKREPEQDFYDCWSRVASEIKKNEAACNAKTFKSNPQLWVK